jgi:hypothetical protein
MRHNPDMRFVALLLTSILVSAVGCAGGASDDAASTDSDLSGTGSCRVLREDNEVVVLRSQDGKMMYAPKQLHVIDVRITNPNPNQNAAWTGSRFASGHIQYTIAAKARPEALAKLGQLVGPGTPAAKVTLDPTTASVDTAIRPVNATASANDDGSANVELDDQPSTGKTAFLDASLRKQLVIGAKANATITCGNNQIPISLNTTGSVAFDVNVAKVLDPSDDLAAIDTFLGTASQIRNNAYKDPLAQVNNADLTAKMNAFADVVDREIKPVTTQYGGSMSRSEMETHLQNAYDAYRDLSAMVLSVTKDANTVDNLQQRNSDGSYSFANNTSTIVTELLPSANAMRANVEKSLADGGDGWVLKDLQ